ncbi:MAG: hypothetical protein LAT80_12045 [Balneolaceae bacterium]|nr:hypothetical protein [Balneolaceae bacterium]
MGKVYYVTGLIILFLVGFFGVYLMLNPMSTDSGEVKLDAHNRIVIEQEWDQHFLEEINETVYRGMSMKLHDESIYISDFSDFQIKSFSLEGTHLENYGNGNGRGPGEFLNISDFSITDSHIWTTDMVSLRITRFPRVEDDLLEFQKSDVPIRVAANEEVVAVQWLNAELLFSLFNNSGEKLFSFGDVLTDSNHSFSLDGWIELSDDYLFYIPIHHTKLYVFDLDNGDLITGIDTPSIQDDPVVEERTEQGQQIVKAPETPYVNTHITYLEQSNLVAISSYYRGDEIAEDEYDEETMDFWIDLYDISTKSYMKSIRLPHALSAFFITEDELFGYNTTSAMAVRYSLDESIKSLMN